MNKSTDQQFNKSTWLHMELKYAFQYFGLNEEEVAQLKMAEDAEGICQLGCWYIYTAPTEDYVERAADCAAGDGGSRQSEQATQQAQADEHPTPRGICKIRGRVPAREHEICGGERRKDDRFRTGAR